MGWTLIGIIFFVTMLVILLAGWLTDKTVVITSYSTEKLRNATIYYYLPENILKIKSTAKIAVTYESEDTALISKLELIEQTFDAKTEIIADTSHLLALNYCPNILMADEIKYAVNHKGLLETINVTTEDRLAHIISKLTNAKETTENSFLGQTEKHVIYNVRNNKKTITKILEFTRDFEIKTISVNAAENLIEWRICIANEFGVESPKFITAHFNISSDDAQSNLVPLPNIINASSCKDDFSIPGILTRPLVNKKLLLKTKGEYNSKDVSIDIIIADTNRIINIPITRSPFVKKSNTITIVDGLVISNEIVHPSIVEGFVSIPVNVAKALISIPAQLIQLKIDNTKRESEFEKARFSLQSSINENRKASLEQKAELEDLKENNQVNEKGKKDELEKIKLDLQKSIDKISSDLENLKTDGRIKFD